MSIRDELHLPTLPDDPKGPSVRSLDEIDRFIEEDYALYFDRASYERRKRELSVDRPFTLPPQPRDPDPGSAIHS
ncbi:MAG: hypothetical protein GF331_08215 [Chitinivibrionales bacterium]|nr:hypothetical protein [Chitinivibrionales bacterium]